MHQSCLNVTVLQCRTQKQLLQPQPFSVKCHRHSEDLLSTRSPHIIWNQVRKRRFLPYNHAQRHVPLHADQSGVWRDVMLCYQAPDSLSTVFGEMMIVNANRFRPVNDGSNGRAFVGARVTSARCCISTNSYRAAYMGTTTTAGQHESTVQELMSSLRLRVAKRLGSDNQER